MKHAAAYEVRAALGRYLRNDEDQLFALKTNTGDTEVYAAPSLPSTEECENGDQLGWCRAWAEHVATINSPCGAYIKIGNDWHICSEKILRDALEDLRKSRTRKVGGK